MALQSDLPQRQLSRICKNCKFYRRNDAHGSQGTCKLAQLIDAAAEPRATHDTLTCSAHVWKAVAKMQQLQILYDTEVIEWT